MLTKEQLYAIAKVCHQANKAYAETLGDTSHKNWEEVTEENKELFVKGIQYRVDNMEASPEAQHMMWMADRIEKGWTHGDVKDVEKKTHPSLVPYNELPEAEKRKDMLFAVVVMALTGELEPA